MVEQKSIDFDVSESYLNKLKRTAATKYSSSGTAREIQPEQCTT